MLLQIGTNPVEMRLFSFNPVVAMNLKWDFFVKFAQSYGYLPLYLNFI